MENQDNIIEFIPPKYELFKDIHPSAVMIPAGSGSDNTPIGVRINDKSEKLLNQVLRQEFGIVPWTNRQQIIRWALAHGLEWLIEYRSPEWSEDWVHMKAAKDDIERQAAMSEQDNLLQRCTATVKRYLSRDCNEDARQAVAETFHHVSQFRESQTKQWLLKKLTELMATIP